MYDLKSFRQEFSTEVLNRLRHFYESHPEIPEGILTQMAYALEGGKKIRPYLLYLSYHTFANKFSKDLFPTALALEAIHAYSLVHDDLPGMDNDTYRRGRLTLHAKYGEGFGILSGDALLNFAYELILSRGNDAAVLKAGQVLAQKAGVCGMIGGQFLDLTAAKEIDIEAMVRGKTCALLEAAVMAGAILGGAKDAQVLALERFATHLGLAYQAKDDLFDRKEDQKEQKVTLISLMTDIEAQEYVQTQTKQALSYLTGIPGEALQDFAELLMHRTN